MLNWDTVNEYAFNLANLIRDVRLEMGTPNLPFIIGELGQAGLHPTGKGSDRHLAMRAAQKNVTLLPEFAQTTLYIPTALYVRENLTSYNKGFHYFGRADVSVFVWDVCVCRVAFEISRRDFRKYVFFFS